MGNLASKPVRGIAVDGSCRGNPAPAEYRGVDIFTGKELFRAEIGEATNNIAEFLGLCHAIHYCFNNNIRPVIYTDSVTAMAWVRNERVNSTFKENPKINERLEKAVKFLKSVPLKETLVVEKWLTDIWGEIPADFGRK